MSDARNEFRHVFEKRIFDRLDSLNSKYENLWKRNQNVLLAADENERVATELYEGLYRQLSLSVGEWQELGKGIVNLFQDVDTSIQNGTTGALMIEAARVELRQSRLDEAARRINRLETVINTSKDIYKQIKRVPANVQTRMDGLRKGIKQCLLEHIDVVEAVKEKRITRHLRHLAKLLEEREAYAENLSEIVESALISREDKEELSRIHLWLKKADEQLNDARAEFRALNQAFSELSLMEKQVHVWHSKYEHANGTELFDAMIIHDLEKRVVALRELWQGYEQDIRTVDEPLFEDRKQRVQFILDEVERFDQDINFVNTCRTGIEDRLNWLKKMGSMDEWISKTATLSPFTVAFNLAEPAARQYEKALITWDNPRPYQDVHAFVTHAKRMEEEIEQCGGAINTLKENTGW